MDAVTPLPWWITECDGKRLLVQAPDRDLAVTYAAATYLKETGRWPRTTTTPHPATTHDVHTWAGIVNDLKRQADTNPNYHPTNLTDSSLAYLPYALDAAAPTTPPPQTPNHHTPHNPLLQPAHLRTIFGGIARLWLWCLAAITPLIASTIYWTGHYLEWWTAIGWNRDTNWFTNRGTFTTYILWILLPTQTLWFLAWLLATGPWLEQRITHAPYIGPAIGPIRGATGVPTPATIPGHHGPTGLA